MMVGSKATHSVVHREAAATVVAQVAKDPPPLPQSDGDQVLVDYPSTPSPQDHVQSKTSQRVFQPLCLRIRCVILDRQTISQTSKPSTVPRLEMLLSF